MDSFSFCSSPFVNYLLLTSKLLYSRKNARRTERLTVSLLKSKPEEKWAERGGLRPKANQSFHSRINSSHSPSLPNLGALRELLVQV